MLLGSALLRLFRNRKHPMILIDGSRHSGSGTILRYAVALATLLAAPVRIVNIRVKRPKPGLRRQHLAALLACARVSRGRVVGAGVGSRDVTYYPGAQAQGGGYAFDVGSAGSTTLLSFCLLIPALYATGPCSFTLTGGLFQDFAPTAFHMQRCLVPLLCRMGAKVAVEVDKPGYVPQGRGRLIMRVEPLDATLRPLCLENQGEIREIQGIALASHLADQLVAPRMAQACGKILSAHGLASSIDVSEDTSAVQPGAALAIWAESSGGAMLGADMAGAPRRPSEKIGRSVAQALLQDIAASGTVDRHLADQLIIFAALAERETTFRIPALTDHVVSNLWLVREILGAESSVQGNIVTVKGIGHRRQPS